MEKMLVKGDVYTVATKTECKVTSANGTPLGTATAEAPYTFTATTDSVVLSDPDAEFARVNPKYAPVKLRLLGLLGGGESTSVLPSGYLAAEFLESTGAQYIKTAWKPLSQKTDNLTSGFKIDQQLIEGRISTMGLVYSNSFLGLSSTAWLGGVVDLYFGSRLRLTINETHSTKRMLVSMNYKDSRELTMQAADFNRTEILSTQAVTAVINNPMPLFTKSTQDSYQDPVAANCRIWSVEFTEGSSVVHNIVAAIDLQGVPCMYDKVSKQAFYNSGTGSFVVGMTCKQALKLAELPAGGGELKVSLPWEAQLDYDVDDAMKTAKSNGWMITVQYRDPEPDNAVYNKYAECVTVADMQAVNADYKNDLTPAGEWLYPLPKLTKTEDKMFAKVRVFKSYMPSCWQSWTMFSATVIEYFECDLPALTNTGYLFYNSQKFRYAKADLSSVGGTNCMFYLARNLVDCYVKLSKLSDDNSLWSGCQLNKASVLYSLPTLPTYTSGTHRITIGIHADHEGDADIEAAIAEAEAKGWTVSTQYNGTATAQAASTWGLRRKPIYAKLEEMVLPDGTQKTILAWGHYVTNWEENGYQEFSSIEEAKEYFNIGD